MTAPHENRIYKILYHNRANGIAVVERKNVLQHEVCTGTISDHFDFLFLRRKSKRSKEILTLQMAEKEFIT